MKEYKFSIPKDLVAAITKFVLEIVLVRLCLIWIIGALLTYLASTVSWLNPRDSTDGPDERSGLAIHTDYKTGCEYLSTAAGGLTPRIDYTGKQLGCR